MIKAWFLLILAISTEVAGTLTMNASGHSGSPWMYFAMYFLITCSYVSLSFSLRKIPVGVAIAIWEGLGAALITVISIIGLGEAVSIQKVVGLILALLGIVLLHFGEKSEQQ
jgi:spermidine export protein MdtJ